MRWLCFALLAACSFKTNAVTATDASADVAADGLSSVCSPNQTACDGRVRKVCGADGHSNPTLDTTCDFTCSQGACVKPSNISITDVAMCGPTAPALAPAPGATVTIGDTIACAPDCGNGVAEIDPVSTDNGLAWFCLSAIDLPAGVALTGNATESIALVSDGAVTIDGEIAFDGGDATQSTAGGVAGPGGYRGSNLTSSSDSDGQGPCAGKGGHHSGSSDHWIGGGGGGGGFLTAGAGGGGGECTHSDHTTTGGEASPASCGTPELIPLVGGSGGGAGGDATINVQQGWAGGGGGGALQISSRISIHISGSIHARGGNGYGENSVDGGGGGGAGGAVLLEAPSITLSGTLAVGGGNGGSSGSGPGGPGETGTAPAAPGATYVLSGQGGSGGGGGAGRIRINAGNAQCSAGASPAASCTTGPLSLQ